jgi:gamma-glutamyltranspeptidase/glutathione hydrolase
MMISRRFLFSFLLAVVSVIQAAAQTSSGAPRRNTMRPVIRGTHYAAASMDPRVSQVMQQVLRAGGNAFDAAVAGQAVLALVAPATNGIGSDAVILIYEARTKRVISLNAEGTAPKLATIEWYKQNQGGKIPVDDTLLSATVPGVVDAWYTLLDRWGSLTFAQALAPAIELATGGFPISERVSNAISGTQALRKYPTSMQVYMPGGKAPAAGEVFENPQFAATLRRLVEAEKQAASKGRHEALKAARDRFYRGDIAREMADFCEKNGGLFRYQDFASYTVKVEEPVSTEYRGYRVYKNPSANQGPAELFALNLLEGYDLKALKQTAPITYTFRRRP